MKVAYYSANRHSDRIFSQARDELASGISLCKYNDAPAFLRENPYIIYGYRPVLSMCQCIKSAFLWTNETLNIWSHFIGFLICFAIMIEHWLFTPNEISWADKLVLCLGLICFQMCLLCSTCYHVFKCHSAESYRKWLNVDFFGISLGFIGCILPAFHLAFYCFETWYNFYMALLALVCLVFVCWHGCSRDACRSLPIVVQTSAGGCEPPAGNYAEDVKGLLSVEVETGVVDLHDNTKCLVGPLLFYVCLSSAGMLPALHWAHLSGGLDSDVSQIFLPRVAVLYLLMFVAFIFYLTKFPECLFPGRFDFVGSSHQCWHVLIVAAFVWWYTTGYQLLIYTLTNRCSALVQE